MFYLPQAVLAWLAAIWLIDWRRWRELLVYGAVGGYTGLFQDHVGELLGLWRYHDVAPFDAHDKISLLIGASAAPLFAMFFVQRLKPGARPPWGWVGIVCAVSMVPELLGAQIGKISYGNGWSLGASIVAHVLVWLWFWVLYRLLSGSGSR